MSVFNYSIYLESDDDDRSAGRNWLIARSTNPELEFSHPIYSSAFGPDDLRDVLLATGWVGEHDGELKLNNDVWHKQLADIVEEILTYFDAPDAPCSPLIEVQEAVAEYPVAQKSNLAIPLYSYAWLDVMARREIADEARGEEDIWRKRKLSVDCASICERRVEALIARYSQPAMRLVGRMAGSVQTRAEDTRDTKTG